MKVKIELVVHPKPDGRIFLNFWNYNGDDIICELREGRLMWDQGVVDGPEIELAFEQFAEKVAEAVAKWKI